MRSENDWTWEKLCLPSNHFLLLERAPEILVLFWIILILFLILL